MTERLDWQVLRDAARHALVEGRLEDAEQRLRQARALAEAAGAADQDDADMLYDLVSVFSAQGKHAEAIATGEEWLRRLEQHPGRDHPTYGHALQVLAVAAGRQGDAARARRLFQKARRVLEEALGRWDAEVADCLVENGDLLSAAERHEEAVALYRRALAIYEAETGPDTPEVCRALTELGRCYDAMQDWNNARRYLRRALAACEHVFGPASVEAAEAAQDLGEHCLADRDYEAARPLLTRALAAFEEEYGPNDLDVALCLEGLSVAHGELHEAEAALVYLRRAIAIYEGEPEAPSARRGALYERFAELAETAGRAEEAAAARRRAEELRPPER